MTPPSAVQVVVAVPPVVVAEADRRCLTAEELRRADRLRVPAARARHVAGRALLRRMLAARVGGAAADVPLVSLPLGALQVDGLPGLHVSVSHTPGLVVVALAEDVPVGVDVERRDRRRLPPLDAWTTPAERGRLATLTGSRHHDALVALWTAKEAVAKALGTGLRTPLTGITILDGHVVAPDGPGTRWRLARVAVPATHVASLATAAQAASGVGSATQNLAPPRSASSTHASPPCVLA